MPKQNGANGEHMVTMREVAKAAGVSIKTVSNVVNDYEFVSQATRDKVNGLKAQKLLAQGVWGKLGEVLFLFLLQLTLLNQIIQSQDFGILLFK